MPRIPPSEKKMPSPEPRRIREYAPRQVFSQHIPVSPPMPIPSIGPSGDHATAPKGSKSNTLPHEDGRVPPSSKRMSLRQHGKA